MGVSTKLTDLSLAEFCRRVASRSPTPGSGSVAALVGALGTGLASMALRSAAGDTAAPCAELERLRESLLERVDQDAEAYEAFRAAPAASPVREQALQRSIAVPAEIAQLSLEALRALAEGASGVRPALASECQMAAGALLAAVEGAAATAAANLPGLGDSAAAADHGFRLGAIRRRARELSEGVRRRARSEA